MSRKGKTDWWDVETTIKPSESPEPSGGVLYTFPARISVPLGPGMSTAPYDPDPIYVNGGTLVPSEEDLVAFTKDWLSLERPEIDMGVQSNFRLLTQIMARMVRRALKGG